MADWIQGTNANAGNVTTASLTLNGVTSGSTLISTIQYNSLVDTYSKVSDDKNAGNYTKLAPQGAGNPITSNLLYFSYMPGAASGNTTITFVFTVGQFIIWIVGEIGPCNTSSPLDVSNSSGVTTSGTNPTAPSITTGSANEVIVAVILSDASNFVATITGFTDRQNNGPGTLELSTKGSAAAATYGGTNYNCGAASDDYAMWILGFKAPAAGTTTVPWPFFNMRAA